VLILAALFLRLRAIALALRVGLALAAARVLLLLSVQFVQNIEDGGRQIVVRLIPSDFEILFPVLRPRPAIIIDVSRIRGGELVGSAVDVSELAQAFDVGVSP